jgi:hypothetical protein
MWDKGIGQFTRYIRRANGGPVSLPQEFPQNYQTVTEQLPFLIEQGREAERYGSISPPVSSPMAYAAEGFQGIERALEGHPFQFLMPGSGIAQVLERKAYGEDPSAMEYGMAALDMADVTPVGKIVGTAAMFLGPAAASGRKYISQLLKREQEGASPQDIFSEQVSDNKRVFRYDVDGRPRIELDISEAQLNKDSALHNANTPPRQIRRYQAEPESTVGKYDIKDFGRVLNEGEMEDLTRRYPFTYSKDFFSAYQKGPLRFGEIIKFPSLLEEYPELAGVRIASMPPGIKAQGMYVPSTQTIYLTQGTEKQTLSTLLHEAQHWIQDYEGFPMGASPDDIPKDLQQRLRDMSQKINQTQKSIENFIAPIVRSSMDVRKGEVTDELVEEEIKKAADAFSSLFKGYEQNKIPNETFSEYVVRREYGRLPDSIKEAPTALRGTSQLLFESLEPFVKRFDKLEEEAVTLQYQARLAAEQAHKKYTSVAGEVESRNMERRLADPSLRSLSPNETLDTPIDEIYFKERIPPTSEIFDDYGQIKTPIQEKALGGGVGSLSHIARTM